MELKSTYIRWKTTAAEKDVVEDIDEFEMETETSEEVVRTARVMVKPPVLKTDDKGALVMRATANGEEPVVEEDPVFGEEEITVPAPNAKVAGYGKVDEDGQPIVKRTVKNTAKEFHVPIPASFSAENLMSQVVDMNPNSALPAVDQVILFTYPAEIWFEAVLQQPGVTKLTPEDAEALVQSWRS